MSARDEDWMFAWAHAAWWRFGESDTFVRSPHERAPWTQTRTAAFVARHNPDATAYCTEVGGMTLAELHANREPAPVSVVYEIELCWEDEDAE